MIRFVLLFMQFLTKELYKGVNNFLGNNGGNNNQDADIRNKITGCTYSDEYHHPHTEPNT